MSIIERLTSLFAPDDCLVCGREGSLFCVACVPALPPTRGHCFGCTATTDNAGCAPCLRQAGLDGLIVACDYSGPAKQLVSSLKFAGNQSAAKPMAVAMMYLWRPVSSAVLVHQPATTAHVRERGFDQSSLIAKEVSRRSGLRHVDVLRRSGQQHQLGADRQQRLQQLTTSLYVSKPAAIVGHEVVLVDDVLTTGASITAAAKVLVAAGATRVTALLFAQSVN